MAPSTSTTAITVTYINIILYALSYQLQRPVEPYLVRSLIHNTTSSNTNGAGGADDNNSSNTTEEETSANVTYGNLTAFFSLIQTIGSPLVGILLDTIGPRYTSLLVYSASGLSYYLLSIAHTPRMLYVSKVPALLQHAFLVGQATVVATLPDSSSTSSSRSGSSGSNDDTATDADADAAATTRRAAALARMTTAYTIGATIGPALGGYLAGTTSDLYIGARLAVWGSLVSVLLSVLYLKDGGGGSKSSSSSSSQSKQHIRHDTATTSYSSSLSTRETFLQLTIKSLHYLTHPTIGPLLFVKFLNGISSSAYTTILPLLVVNKLHFTTHQLGYFMSCNSFTIAIFSAIGMSYIMKYVNNQSDRLAYVCIGYRIVCMILFGIVVSHVISSSMLLLDSTTNKDVAASNNNIGLVILTTVISILISLSSHVHATAITTLTTGIVTPNERGTILGLEHGLFSLARIVGPPLGTMLLSSSSSSTALSFFGIVASSDTVGLWRVIAMCTIMDIVLMICLYSWSSKRLQYSLNVQQKKSSDDDDEEESDGGDRGVHIPLLDMSGSSSDKDHSD